MNRVYIWGAGKNCAATYDAIDKKKYEVVGVVDADSKKQGGLWNNKLKIHSPQLLKVAKFDVIVVSVYAYDSVVEQCREMALMRDDIAVYYDFNDTHEVFCSEKRKFILLELELEKYKIMLNNAPYEHSGADVVFPVIKDATELANKIVELKCSLCRFGDGEFEIIRNNARPLFQDPNAELGQRLLHVLQSDKDNILVAIPRNFSSLSCYNQNAAQEIRKYMSVETRSYIMGVLQNDRIYYDAYISRPYILYKNRKNADMLFPLLKQIWKNREILIVEGEYSRMGVNNDLLEGATSIRRILCPQKNAFNCYQQILDAVKNSYTAGELVLISLGPTATVLAYDLACSGIQAIDIGQIDNEYEWYLRKAKARTPIKGKCVAEVDGCYRRVREESREYVLQVFKRIYSNN